MTSPGYHTAFISHDELAVFCTDDDEAAHKAQHCLDANPGKSNHQVGAQYIAPQLDN